MNIAGQYLKNLDEQIEKLKVISRQLTLIRQDLEELVGQPEETKEEHQAKIDDFIDRNYEKVYEKYCDIHPERIHSDFMLEDLDYDELCEFVDEQFDI